MSFLKVLFIIILGHGRIQFINTSSVRMSRRDRWMKAL